MTDKGTDREPYVKPLPPGSEGTAPGRGRLAGRHILVVGGGQRVLDAASDLSATAVPCRCSSRAKVPRLRSRT